MKFGSLDGGVDGDYNGNHFEETSKTAAMQDAFFSLELGHLTEFMHI